MTKVEELRDAILKKKHAVSDMDVYGIVHTTKVLRYISGKELDSLIAAAEAQGEAKGRAEGAAEERERIKAWLKNLDNPALERVVLPMQAFFRFTIDVDTLVEFIDQASLLAPATKSEVKP